MALASQPSVVPNGHKNTLPEVQGVAFKGRVTIQVSLEFITLGVSGLMN